MTIISDEFSEMIRGEVETNGCYIGPVFTEEEVDALFDDEDDINDSYTIDLAEAAFYRESGIKVDLAVQGPAAMNVAKAIDETKQKHNTYTVEVSDTLFRDYSDIPDSELPTYTPEDLNVSVKSLDFTSSKPRANRLDLIMFEAQENPIEKSLMDQLTVVQALEHLGADVESLYSYLDTKWGIDYTRELVRDAAIAPIADLEKYLATGGRPAPQVYYSANLMSTMRIIQRPTVDLHGVGYTSAFFGRSAMICKMIMANLHLVYGKGCVKRFSFHANPSQFNTFKESTLTGKKLVAPKCSSRTMMHSSIAGLTSKDDFLRTRQAMKQAETAATVAIQNDLKAIEGMTEMPKMGRFVDMMRGFDVFDPMSPSNFVRKTPVESVAPSKVTTILYGALHHDGMPIDYLVTYGAVVATLALQSIDDLKARVAKKYSVIMGNPAMRHVVQSINIGRAASSIPELGDAMYQSPDSRRFAALYLILRQHSLLKISYADAWATAGNWVVTGDCVSKCRATHSVMDKRRSVKVVLDILRVVKKTRPFSYVAKSNIGMANSKFAVSLFDGMKIHTVQKEIEYMQWVDSIGKGNIQKHLAKATNLKVRPIFSKMRDTWAGFYRDLSDNCINAARLIWNLMDIAPASIAYVTWSEDMPTHVAAYIGLAAESVHYEGIRLAYKFANISIGKVSKETFTDTSVEHYTKFLLTDEEAIVSMESERGRDQSAFQTEVDDAAQRIANCYLAICWDLPTLTEYLNREYLSSECYVKRSIDEMVTVDRSRVVITNPTAEAIADSKMPVAAAPAMSALVDNWNPEGKVAKVEMPEWLRTILNDFENSYYGVEKADAKAAENLAYICDNAKNKITLLIGSKKRLRRMDRDARLIALTDSISSVYDKGAYLFENLEFVARKIGKVEATTQVMV